MKAHYLGHVVFYMKDLEQSSRCRLLTTRRY